MSINTMNSIKTTQLALIFVHIIQLIYLFYILFTFLFTYLFYIFIYILCICLVYMKLHFIYFVNMSQLNIWKPLRNGLKTNFYLHIYFTFLFTFYAYASYTWNYILYIL